MARFLLEGFSKGFPLNYHGPRQSFFASNLESATSNPAAVDLKLSQEIGLSRISGPFDHPPFKIFWVSPLGLVPKKVPGEFRMIHHLSFPKGNSINDGIPSEYTHVQYARIDDAIRMIKVVGQGCFLAKTDIKSAFRILPIRPEDYSLLGMRWKEKFYFDKCMPMGCSSSCRTFESFSTALEWIAQRKLGIKYILHILDDFLIIAGTSVLCQAQLNLFLKFCQVLGVPMAPEKTLGPLRVLSFAGIELDTCNSEARLPQEKIEKCLGMLEKFLKAKKVCLRDLQSLTGLLNFTCSVVIPGRAFLRRLFDLTIGVSKPHHLIRLNNEVKADLRIWQQFLYNFNGRSFFLEDIWHTSKSLKLFTDAAGSLGFGALFEDKWCYGEWPPH